VTEVRRRAVGRCRPPARLTLPLASTNLLRVLARRFDVRPAATYRIRRLTHADVDRVYDLHCEWARESAPAPKQLDRWGPGIAVFVPPEDETRPGDYELTPIEPSQAVRHTLGALVDGRDAGCLVAFAGSEAAGFVTFARVTHPAMPGQVGAIDMLYVRAPHRRQGVGTALVRGALDELREWHVHVFRAEHDRSNTQAARFFKSAGWSQAALHYLHE
jgi:ribosomal protein S18 acetylase RimI-like enzyme